MARPRKNLEDGAPELPARLILNEGIGWMDNGCLVYFHADQIITDPRDIERLIAHNADFLELP